MREHNKENQGYNTKLYENSPVDSIKSIFRDTSGVQLSNLIKFASADT